MAQSSTGAVTVTHRIPRQRAAPSGQHHVAVSHAAQRSPVRSRPIPSVAAVGGSWMVPRDRVKAGDFEGIRTLTADAVALTRA